MLAFPVVCAVIAGWVVRGELDKPCDLLPLIEGHLRHLRDNGIKVYLRRKKKRKVARREYSDLQGQANRIATKGIPSVNNYF